MLFCEERQRKEAVLNMNLIIAWKAIFAILTLSTENLLYKCSLSLLSKQSFYPLILPSSKQSFFLAHDGRRLPIWKECLDVLVSLKRLKINFSESMHGVWVCTRI